MSYKDDPNYFPGENLMEPEREPIGYCWVCERLLFRDEADDWVYFHSVLVCKNHPGVEEWYRGALAMGEEKLKIGWAKDAKE